MPFQLEYLRNKYAAINAEKEVKRGEKKAKYNNENLPVVEIRIPWCWADEPSNGPIAGKEIDLEGRHKDWPDAIEKIWRISQRIKAKENNREPYEGPVKRKIIRT